MPLNFVAKSLLLNLHTLHFINLSFHIELDTEAVNLEHTSGPDLPLSDVEADSVVMDTDLNSAEMRTADIEDGCDIENENNSDHKINSGML